MVNFDTFENPPADLKEVSRFSVVAGNMEKKIIKSKFSQINDKRFSFPGGILFLPFYHPNLKELNEFKKKMDQRVEKYFGTKKKSC